jgi:hypothetical protein
MQTLLNTYQPYQQLPIPHRFIVYLDQQIFFFTKLIALTLYRNLRLIYSSGDELGN